MRARRRTRSVDTGHSDRNRAHSFDSAGRLTRPPSLLARRPRLLSTTRCRASQLSRTPRLSRSQRRLPLAEDAFDLLRVKSLLSLACSGNAGEGTSC